MDALVGLGPVLLGALLVGAFIALLAVDRVGRKRSSGYRDNRPAPGRLMFSGVYYQLEQAYNQPDYIRPQEATVGAASEKDGDEPASDR